MRTLTKNNKIITKSSKGLFSKKEKDFIIKVKTDITGYTGIYDFLLPLDSNLEYDFNIDWGDGKRERITSSESQRHTYAIPGVHTIRIHGKFPSIRFNSEKDHQKLIEIVNWGDIKWENLGHAFDGCENMIGTYTDKPDLSNVTNMEIMFMGCTLFNSPVDFDTSNITNIRFLLRDCTSFNQPINLDVSNCNDISHMFRNCSSLNKPVNLIGLNSAFWAGGIFAGCTLFNQPLSGMHLDNAHFIDEMFLNCTAFNQDISSSIIQSVDNANDFLTGATSFSTENYDKLLISWANQSHKSNVVFGCSSKYTAGGPAETARNQLLSDGWTITDGGPV